MNFNKDSDEKTKSECNDDRKNFIWGIFYYNPKDNRLFPPRRIKHLGWTINFANPNSALLVIAIIAIFLILKEQIF